MKVRTARKTNIWLYPTAIERDFSRELVEAMRLLNAELEAGLADVRFDGWLDDLNQVTASLRQRAARIFSTVRSRVNDYYEQTNKFNDTQWMIAVRSGTGYVINSVTVVAEDAVGKGKAFYYDRLEQWQNETKQAWVSNTQSLIDKVWGAAIDTFADIVRSGGLVGKTARDIAALLDPRMGINVRRAEGVSRGNIGFLNGVLTKNRQEDAGIEEYYWRGKLDDRERRLHVLREGLKFRFDNPPSDGQIGTAWGCRCWPEAIFTNSIFNKREAA